MAAGEPASIEPIVAPIVGVASQAMPKKKSTSPRRVTRNAFFAARIASGFSNQKPMSRYDVRPMISQQT